jgi:hypothetical protein
MHHLLRWRRSMPYSCFLSFLWCSMVRRSEKSKACRKSMTTYDRCGVELRDVFLRPHMHVPATVLAKPQLGCKESKGLRARQRQKPFFITRHRLITLTFFSEGAEKITTTHLINVRKGSLLFSFSSCLNNSDICEA